MFAGFQRFQFSSTFGDGVDAQARDECQAAVAAVPQFLGFQANIQSLLPLIQCAHQEIHLLMQLFDRIGTTSSTLGTLAVMDRLFFHKHSPP